MNPIVLKVLAMLPWWRIAKWLLAETGWQRDVAQWLAAENEWYFRLAATLWGGLASDTPTVEMKTNLLLKENR